eukprot:1886764-Alexandrium_andersonii.AAC.1
MTPTSASRADPVAHTAPWKGPATVMSGQKKSWCQHVLSLEAVYVCMSVPVRPSVCLSVRPS